MATSSASGSDSRILVRINSDSSANYSTTYLTGDGSNAFSARDTNRVQIDGAVNISSSPNFGQVIYQFQNYTNTNIFKTILQRGSNLGNTSGIGTSAAVSLYRQTSAITSLNILTGGPTPGNFVSGSTFNLYGVANASITNVAKATGGDSVYTDGTYWYHIFRSSGTFTPTQALTADYLVVAGGGGGGAKGGGGGAGGLRCTVGATGGGGSLESALSLTAQAYTVTIGAGGIASTTTTAGGDGSNSVFATITSTGGGGGGTDSGTVKNGRTGGSGGGAAGGGYSPSGTGGAGTANQGYAGANNTGSAPYNGGGGGGAGAAGTGGTAAGGAVGGVGVQTSISGTATYYAGGGGGGWDSVNGGTGANNAGGNGGGGTGTNTVGTAGTANTGGGGGAGGWNGTTQLGAAGGSGIVIVRYSAA